MTEEQERWKPIPEYPGYEVSDHGRVRSYHTNRGFGRWRIGEKPNRILKPGRQTSGYQTVGLRNAHGNVESRLVHHLVLEAFVGPRPDGFECCHTDGNRENNLLANLRYDTPSGNHSDIDRETFIDAIRSRLSDETVIAIRKDRAAGVSVSHIAKQHGVTKAQIYNICTGKTYSVVGGPRTSGRIHSRNMVAYSSAQQNNRRLVDTKTEYEA